MKWNIIKAELKGERMTSISFRMLEGEKLTLKAPATRLRPMILQMPTWRLVSQQEPKVPCWCRVDEWWSGWLNGDRLVLGGGSYHWEETISWEHPPQEKKKKIHVLQWCHCGHFEYSQKTVFCNTQDTSCSWVFLFTFSIITCGWPSLICIHVLYSLYLLCSL